MRISLGAVIRTGCAVAAAILVRSAALAASTETDFKQVYAAADAAEKEAGLLRNQWIAAEAALSEARAAAEKNDFERAIAAAKEAEALAKASIFQATSEKAAWKDLEIRP
jgi:hypothetical protein